MKGTWRRNVEGLQRTAQAKSQAACGRAEEAIRLLIKEQRPINFKTVAETAQVSTAWLYQQESLRQRIIHLRSQQAPRAGMKVDRRERASDTSKDTIIAALRQRVKKQEVEIRALREQLEVAYGRLSTELHPKGDLD